MRKNLISVLVVATLAVTGVAVGVTQADAATQPHRPSGISLAASHTSGTVKTGYKPKTMNYSVDGAYKIINIHWKSWGTKTATGYGTVRKNNCVPDCATSTSFWYQDVTLNASQVKKNKFTMVDVQASYTNDAGTTRNK